MIQAITFDLWNTLFNNKSYSELRIQKLFRYLQEKEITVPFDEFKNAFDTKFHFSEVTFEEINFRHIFTEERISSVLNEINIELLQADLEIIKEEFESIMLQDPPTLKKGVKSTLRILTPDFKIGLISNTGVTPGSILSEVLERYDILQYFDETIYSDEIGYFKPHRKMFKIPLEKFNCKPQNAIHIGDMLETDVRGAKEFNMLTAWFNDSNKTRSSDIVPDYEIQQITEVIQIVQSLS
ncbi:hypothetical protein LCGC14_0596120 [marine sediment metagenome]|uniref:HAD family hydrolase n=1 Tax=marine sediment metagenome TaxID=412755 RepID=A0A0F9RVR9_9ZZZZ|nr:MAG: putative HAD-hydrolase [Candidatus Lokiarchaeum sp. GC14_75]